MGAYHTLDLEVNRKFVLAKQEWDSITLDRIEQVPTVILSNSANSERQ